MFLPIYLKDWKNNNMDVSNAKNTYKRKLVIVEAVQWGGSIDTITKGPQWLKDAAKNKHVMVMHKNAYVRGKLGTVLVGIGDWIIKCSNGKIKLYREADFSLDYEKVKE